MTKRNLIITFGGVSPEHEVSVLTGIQCVSVLKETDFNLIPLYITKTGQWFTGSNLLELESFKDLKKIEKESIPCYITTNETGSAVLKENKKGFLSNNQNHVIDTVLTAFHGSSGENGSFQGLCEMFNIPYTGSGVKASAIGMDKIAAKNLCRDAKIPVVEGINFNERKWIEDSKYLVSSAESLDYPVVVKPVSLGSSIGVSIVNNRDELKNSIETAFRYDANLLVEKAISPLIEINCSVLGSAVNCRASICERPVGKDELLSFRDKYQSEGDGKGMASADRIIPADIKPELAEKIQETACSVFALFGCSGVARLDFLVNSETDQIYFNEINTIPGSFSFYLWKESGLDFKTLLSEMINIAKEEHRKKNGRIQSYDTNLLSEKAVKGIKGLKNSK